MLRAVAIVAVVGLPVWAGCGTGDTQNEADDRKVVAQESERTAEDEAVQESAEVLRDEAIEPADSDPAQSAADEPSVVAPSTTLVDEMDELADFDVGFEEDRALPPYNAITREEFDACWQTSLKAQGESAGELLTRLTAECGFKMEDQPRFAEALATAVNFELTGVSRLQLIEEVCGQAGLYPRYRLDRFALAEGPRPYPIAFAGPFLVEVRELQENPPHGTGMISLQFTGCTMSPDVNSWLQSRGRVSAVASIRGSGGIDVSEHHSYSIENPAATAQVVRYRSHQNLMFMTRSVDAIELLAGTLSFKIPGPLSSCEFESLEPGQTAKIRELAIELLRVELDDVSTIEVLLPNSFLQSELQIVARDIEGKILESRLASGAFLNKEWTIQGVPHAVELQLWETTDIAYPFEIANIPLARSAEQPDAIEPLTFPGDLPVTLSNLRKFNDDAGLRFVVTAVNHTNKDLSLIHIGVRYLDGKRELLGFDDHSQPGFPVVAAGESVDIEIPGAFAPEGTETIIPELNGIRAPDATQWFSTD